MKLREAPTSVGRRYHALLVATAALLLIGVAAINIYAERSTGQLVTDNVAAHATRPGEQSERAEKSALLARYQQPQFVIVGPSMAQRWDPQRIRTATGKRGFNASMVSQSITDMRSIVQWLAGQAASRSTSMPHVIAVIPPEAFTIQPETPSGIDLPGATPPSSGFDQLRTSTLRAVKLTQYAALRQGVALLRGANTTPAQQRHTVSGNQSSRATTTPLTPAELASRQDAPQSRSEADPNHVPGAPNATAVSQQFRGDGYLTSGAFFGSEAWAEGSLDRFVLSQNIQFYDQVRRRGGPGRIEPSAQREFRALVQAAHDAGDTPTIVLPPMSEDLAAQLDKLGRAAYMKTLRSWLQAASHDLDFRLFDYDDPSQFTDAETAFYDGSHPQPALASAVVDQLSADDPLLRRN